MTRSAPPLRWRGKPDAKQLTELRQSIEDWFRRARLSSDLLEAVSLAVYEAMANAVEHAYPDGEAGELDLEVRHDGGALTAVVADHGVWLVARSEEPNHRGRGLALIEGLADQVTVLPTPHGTTVRMRWPLSPLDVRAVQETEVTGDETDAEQRLRLMEAITDTELARLDTETLLREMLVRVRDLLVVDCATVLLHDRASDHLVATAAVGLEDEVRQGVRIPVGEGFDGRVAAQRRPLVTDQVDATTVLSPSLWENGIRVLLGVPMLAGGVPMGVLRVGVHDHRTFTDQDISLLQVAADRLALAVRIQVANAESSATTALQRSLLPSRLPTVPHLDFAARYVPGAQLGIGGDWYDVFRLPRDRIGVVIGDVAGHGFPAAVVMGRLRSALRAYALDNEAPHVVLDKLDRKACHFEAGVMATVAYGVVEPGADRLSLCLAGHLPPAVAVSGAPSVFVDAAVDPPIGFALRRARRSHTVTLPPGATVCFFTDGLVERRDRPIDEGLASLLDTMSDDTAEAVCAKLMNRFVGTRSMADDVALLVMHRTKRERV